MTFQIRVPYRKWVPAAGAFVAVLVISSGVAAQGSPAAAPRPFLGVRFDSEATGIAKVASVLPGSPADRAGLRAGDGLVEVAGRPVSSSREVIEAIAASSVGASVPLVVARSGQRQTVTAVLGPAPAPGQVSQSFVGRAAPSFALPRVDGTGRVDLGALRGRVVLVYFWSIYCGACRMATPDLIRLHRTFENRGLSIVGVSDDPIDRLQQAAGTLSLGFPLVHDMDAKVGGSYWVTGVPAFYLVDRSGNVAYAAEGWDAAVGTEMERQIIRLLGPGGP